MARAIVTAWVKLRPTHHLNEVPEGRRCDNLRSLRWLTVKVPQYRVEERGFYKP